MCVWAGLAVVQALFWSLVYPGLVEDKLAQFTDICSIANIRQDGAKNPPNSLTKLVIFFYFLMLFFT